MVSAMIPKAQPPKFVIPIAQHKEVSAEDRLLKDGWVASDHHR